MKIQFVWYLAITILLYTVVLRLIMSLLYMQIHIDTLSYLNIIIANTEATVHNVPQTILWKSKSDNRHQCAIF